MKAQAVQRGKSVALNANKFTRSGYKFAGWNTKANGKGKSYKNKAKVKNLAKAGKTVKLYARWKRSADLSAVYSSQMRISNKFSLNSTNYVESISLKKGRLVVKAGFSLERKVNGMIYRSTIPFRTYTFKFAKGCKCYNACYYGPAPLAYEGVEINRYLSKKAFVNDCRKGNSDGLGLVIKTNKSGSITAIYTSP